MSVEGATGCRCWSPKEVSLLLLLLLLMLLVCSRYSHIMTHRHNAARASQVKGWWCLFLETVSVGGGGGERGGRGGGVTPFV